MVYAIIISITGCFLLFVLSLLSFGNAEALKLHHGTNVARGFQLLLSSLVS